MSLARVKFYIRKFTQEPGSDEISYINAEIEGARTAHSDREMNILARNSGETREELARVQAEIGWPANAASLLSPVNTLPVGEKGELLAQAYEGLAEKSEYWADHSRFIRERGKYQRDAEKSRRIAQGLTRAAKRLQKP